MCGPGPYAAILATLMISSQFDATAGKVKLACQLVHVTCLQLKDGFDCNGMVFGTILKIDLGCSSRRENEKRKAFEHGNHGIWQNGRWFLLIKTHRSYSRCFQCLFMACWEKKKLRSTAHSHFPEGFHKAPFACRPMPVLHRWDPDESSDDQRPAQLWRYDETSEDESAASSSEGGSLSLGGFENTFMWSWWFTIPLTILWCPWGAVGFLLMVDREMNH